MRRGTAAALALAATACVHPRPLHYLDTDVRAADGLSCRAYLAWEQESVTDAFLFLHGTGTGSSAFVPDVAEKVLRTRPAALVTFDKPGVRAPFGNPAAARLDEEVFQRHTQGSLSDCAEQALSWAAAALGPSVRLHLRGHSERSLIALELYQRLLDKSPTQGNEVAIIGESFIAMSSIPETIEGLAQAAGSDGIHPTAAGSTATGNAIWEVMVANCVAQ